MNEVASRYAQALFSLCLDDNNVIPMQEEMKELQRIFKENPNFINVLDSHFLTIKERQDMIDNAFKGVSNNIISLFKIVIDHNRANYIDDIFIEFNSLCNEYRGIDEGIVYSVNPLTETVIQELEKKISKLENTNIELRNLIDPSLIGGVKIQIHEHIYDGSVKNQLEQMKKDLLKKEGN